MQQLQDVFILQNMRVINEGKTGPLKVRGIFQRADEANNNRRIYPQKVLEGAIKSLNESIKDRRLVGELDHPTYDMVKLSNASHLITGLWMEGKEVIGEAEILPTPAGKVVQGLIEGGVKIGISSRGMGTLSESKGDYKTVNEDFKLVTFDIVADPSTRGAYPTLAESKQLTRDKRIIESTIKNVVSERYFLKLLEQKIDAKLSRVDEKKFSKDTANKIRARQEKKAAKEKRAVKASKKANTEIWTGKVGSRKHKKALKNTLPKRIKGISGKPSNRPDDDDYDPET
jgi:hypothetical protein